MASSSISSYLPSDTYNSLPKDGDLTFLHTMLRVRLLADRALSNARAPPSRARASPPLSSLTRPSRSVRASSSSSLAQVDDLDKTMAFFSALGLRETRRKESEKGKFTLVFMASAPGAPEIELTHNWGGETFAPPSRSMGHLAYATDDIYKLCADLQEKGIIINRPPRDGKMAFVKSPDGISVELLQKGEPLEPAEPWASMENTGEW